MRDDIINDYFEWLSSKVAVGNHANGLSYRKLLMKLHDSGFRYSIARDRNRALDGKELRYRYSQERGYDYIPDCLETECSILEMMVALSIRCEETIMDDAQVGDRTAQWFWQMIVSLGLGSCSDDRYRRDYVESVIHTFLDRDYERNGKGGLFTIRGPCDDLRDVEIWIQLLWYLDSIT